MRETYQTQKLFSEPRVEAFACQRNSIRNRMMMHQHRERVLCGVIRHPVCRFPMIRLMKCLLRNGCGRGCFVNGLRWCHVDNFHVMQQRKTGINRATLNTRVNTISYTGYQNAVSKIGLLLPVVISEIKQTDIQTNKQINKQMNKFSMHCVSRF